MINKSKNRYVKKNNSFFVTLKNAIAENIIKYFKEYFIVTICFMIGIVAGVIFINNLSDNQSSEIATYISSFLETLREGIDLNYLELLKESVIRNSILVLILWFVGATLIGIPLVFAIVVFRGFCLGYTISAIIHILGISKGIIFVLTTIFLQNIIFIPAVIALAVSGIRLYQIVVKNRNTESIKFAILKHTVFSFVIWVLLIIASIIEVYCSTNFLGLCIKFL